MRGEEDSGKKGRDMEAQADQTTFRGYMFFLSGQMASLLGSSIAGFAIIWWVTLETKSPVYLSVASFAGFAPMVLLTPFAGVYADRWNRKLLIGIVDFMQASATVSLIFLFWLRIASIWHILAISAIRGVFQAFHSPTVSTLVPLMVPKDKLSRINGLNYLFSGVMNLVGPIVAALLMQLWKIHEILWIDAITFITAVIPLIVITIPPVRKVQEESREKPSFKEEFVKGFTFIRSAKGFMPLLMTATVLNFLIMPFFTLLPYYVKFNHFGEAADLAFVTAFLQGGMLSGGLLMSVIKGFKKKMVATVFSICAIFLGCALVALAPIRLFWYMAVGVLILGFFLPVANVSTQTIIQTIVPTGIYGRVNSVIIALADIASPLGMMSSGPIAEFIGTANLFLGCSFLGILTVTLSWLFTNVRHVEKIEERMRGSAS